MGFAKGFDSGMGIGRLGLAKKGLDQKKEKQLYDKDIATYNQLKGMMDEMVSGMAETASKSPEKVAKFQIQKEEQDLLYVWSQRMDNIAQRHGLMPGYVQLKMNEIGKIKTGAQQSIDDALIDVAGESAGAQARANDPAFAQAKQVLAQMEGVNTGLGNVAQIQAENQAGFPELQGKANAQQNASEFSAMIASGTPVSEAGKKLAEMGITPGSPEYEAQLRRSLDSNILDEKTRLDIEMALLKIQEMRSGMKAAEEQGEKAKSSAIGSAANVLDEIDHLLPKVNFLTTGLVGQVLGGIGGTDAYTVRASVDTLKGNLAFERIEKLKLQSRTGATGLGPISEKELNLLEKQLTALDPNMKADDFERALLKAEGHYKRALLALHDINPDENDYNDYTFDLSGTPTFIGEAKNTTNRTRVNINKPSGNSGSQQIGRFSVIAE